jgi:hypothetical protein
MSRRYRSAVWLFLLLSGCAPQKQPERVLSLSLHWLPGCAGDANEGATVELSALGDFDASPVTAEAFSASESGRELSFPPLTRAVEARLDTGNRHWLGVAERDRDAVQLPLWPADGACPLFPLDDSPGYPGPVPGEAMGWAPAQHTLLIAGELSASSSSAQAVSVDLQSGKASRVPGGMLQGRAYSTITPFGGNLLVAGGLDTQATHDLGKAPPLDSALVYNIAKGRFDRADPIALSRARAHHAALVLPSGETLLVGGMGNAGEALVPLEAVSPADGTARVTGLATPAVGRIDPAALRLDDGRILICGGTDSNGKPIGLLEWLTADAASAYFTPAQLPPRFDRAFVAMPGGGALAVGGCEDRAPKNAGEDCSACERGCPPSGGYDAWWITPEGVPEQLPDLPVDAPHPELVPAENGAPWLWSARARSWLRFDPWQARFVPVAPDLAPGPDAGMPAPVAIDPGAFVWLSSDGQHTTLGGFRHGTRERFAFDLLPLLGGVPPSGSFPDSPAWHLAPDRSPLGANAEVRFDPAQGLVLDGDYATALLTDTSYAPLRLEMTLGGGSPPRVRLGSREVGGADCPWPAAGPDTLVLIRNGATLQLQRGQRTETCSLGVDRVTVALAAGGSARHSVIRGITVRRSMP